jgi:hypothetical protein
MWRDKIMTQIMEDAAKREPTKAFEDAAPYLSDPAALRDKADHDGYLFIKGLIQKDIVMSLRKDILNILDNQGFLDKSQPLMEGIANLEAIHNRLSEEDVNFHGVGVPIDIYREVQKLESFHALAHETRLLKLYEILFGETPFPHPRNIGRIMMPHKKLHKTPSHQDFLHIQGAEQTWTSWIPIGDAPQEMGSLAILEGSHKSGLLGVSGAKGAGGLESILCGLGYEWVAGDYCAGDLVTFNSLTVHKALSNQMPDKIRLSADMRYQPASHLIERNSLNPHGPYEWDDLYEGWQRKDLQYYWKTIDFTYKPYDESIRWQKDKIC